MGSSVIISFILKYFCVPTNLMAVVLITISVVMKKHRVECVELRVGGDNGWAVPSAKNDMQVYNDWASNNRFQVNDTLRLEYKKDSVMVVTEEEYEKCRSTHPIFFYNNGDTVFKLDRPGLFYFISGVAGHCQKGLKMVIKVLDPPPKEREPSSAHKPNFPYFVVLFFCVFQFVFVYISI